MNVDVCQRWRSGRCTWRPAGELFDSRAHEVAVIADDTTARRFVVEHHYSKTYPAARRRFGLRGPGGALVGVAVYSVPARAAVLSPIPGGMAEALELGRFVLLDRVPANAESWFLARTFELLRREGFAGAVSFSDPHPRATADGRTVFAGHIGTIYQSVNAVYLGRSKRHQLLLLPDGRSFNRRALSKIRRRERGWRYAVERDGRESDLYAARGEAARLRREVAALRERTARVVELWPEALARAEVACGVARSGRALSVPVHGAGPLPTWYVRDGRLCVRWGVA